MISALHLLSAAAYDMHRYTRCENPPPAIAFSSTMQRIALYTNSPWLMFVGSVHCIGWQGAKSYNSMRAEVTRQRVLCIVYFVPAPLS